LDAFGLAVFVHAAITDAVSVYDDAHGKIELVAGHFNGHFQIM